MCAGPDRRSSPFSVACGPDRLYGFMCAASRTCERPLAVTAQRRAYASITRARKIPWPSRGCNQHELAVADLIGWRVEHPPCWRQPEAERPRTAARGRPRIGSMVSYVRPTLIISFQSLGGSVPFVGWQEQRLSERDTSDLVRAHVRNLTGTGRSVSPSSSNVAAPFSVPEHVPRRVSPAATVKWAQ